MDDLLKSLDNEREAIKPIKDVKVMCASGGFKLTKFEQQQHVLQSIDEADRRQGVKDKEQALGVLLDTERQVWI